MKATAAFSFKGSVYAKGDAVNVSTEDAAYLTKRKLVSGSTEKKEETKAPEKKESSVTFSTEKKTIKKP